MSEYFPESKSSGGETKVNQIYLIMLKKADLKNATGCDTSEFAKMTDLANLKYDVDK